MDFRGKLVGADAVVTVCTEGDRIASVSAAETNEAIGGDDVWIAPAIFDVQVNGVGGINYKASDLTGEKVIETTEWMHKSGTGIWCPTLTTDSTENLMNGLSTLAEACEESGVADASFAGFHVEGPYIGSEDGPRGAHPLAHVRDPDWDEFQRFQEAAGGRIVIFTLSPEREGSLEFIEKAAATGVTVSIGHSGASRERIREAVAAGAKMSTHLGNGAHAELPRHDNYIWEQLAADELWAGMIPDGFHLPDPVLKSFYRAKGKERICLVSDVASIAGLEPGVYGRTSGLGQSELHPSGLITLVGTPYLAGAGRFLDMGIPNAVRVTDATLTDAIEMTSINPARLLGMDDRVGSVEVGKEASLTLFRWAEGQDKLEIVATVVRGQVVYGG